MVEFERVNVSFDRYLPTRLLSIEHKPALIFVNKFHPIITFHKETSQIFRLALTFQNYLDLPQEYKCSSFSVCQVHESEDTSSCRKDYENVVVRYLL